MTDNPVAAANARTMWKRETPPIAAISSRVNASPRWLSINQSAFWAGFMDDSLRSKLEHHDRFARASFDSPCFHSSLGNRNRTRWFLPLRGKYQRRRRWNAKKVPQIFVSSGAAKWNDPKNFPWTIGWQPSYQVEARIYAAYILKNYPGKTIGVLYQNDDFGKD